MVVWREKEVGVERGREGGEAGVEERVRGRERGGEREMYTRPSLIEPSIYHNQRYTDNILATYNNSRLHLRLSVPSISIDAIVFSRVVYSQPTYTVVHWWLYYIITQYIKMVMSLFLNTFKEIISHI